MQGRFKTVVQRWQAAALAGMLLPLACPMAQAGPTLSGSTGLVKIPTAYVLRESAFQVGFNWSGGPESLLFAPRTNRMYYATIGLLPGLELSLNMLQVIGWIDPEAPGAAYAFHRLSNLKYQLPLPAAYPKLAIGLQDPVSANALTLGPSGQTNYGLTTAYGVVSQPLGPVNLHIGYGTRYINGLFAGADVTLADQLNLRAEYDSRRINVGCYWQPAPWWSLHVARLFPDDWAYGTALVWSL